MKAIIIILVICCVLYCIGIGQDQPAPKAPARNRSEDNTNTLGAFLNCIDDWQQIAADNKELQSELSDLYHRVESAKKFGFTTSEFNDIRSSMKHYMKVVRLTEEI